MARRGDDCSDALERWGNLVGLAIPIAIPLAVATRAVTSSLPRALKVPIAACCLLQAFLNVAGGSNDASPAKQRVLAVVRVAYFLGIAYSSLVALRRGHHLYWFRHE